MNAGERQAIELDVARVIPRFYAYLDEQEYEKLAELMAPDGVWYRAGKELRGRARLLEAMAGRGPERRSRHLITNLLVDVVDGDRAEVAFYSTAFVHLGGDQSKPAPMELPSSIGAYRAMIVRMEDGWRIETLKSKAAFKR